MHNTFFCTSCLFCFFLRAKYHKLKYGTELNQGDMKPPSYDSGKHRFIHTYIYKAAGTNPTQPNPATVLLDTTINPADLQTRS